MDSSLESDDSVGDPSYTEPCMKKELDMDLEGLENASCDSNLTKDFYNRRASSTNPNNASRSVNERMPLIFNGKYYKIVKRVGETDHQKKARGILAQCSLCISMKIIKGSLNITSNFIQHLKKRHTTQYEEYLKEKNEIGKSPKAIIPKTNVVPEPITSAYDENVLAFVIDNALPLSIVERPSFLALFEGTGLFVCTKKNLMNILDKKHNAMLMKLRDTLSDVSYLCTTINIWLCKRKYLFGYTCHWIDDTFTRKSAALAFRKFDYEQAYDRIPDFIQQINNEFGIDDKIVNIITDCDENIVNAFKEYGVKDYYEDDDDDDDDDTDEEEQAKMLRDLSSFSPKLPKNNKCVIHNLISLAIIDFICLLKSNKTVYYLHKTAFQRCSEIWKKSTAPDKTEMIKSFVPFSVKFPTSTNWLTLYDSIKCLLDNKDKLYNLCFFVETTQLNVSELEYLNEYCLLMEPIAEALKFLQTESQMFYGYFLPTLVTIKVKLNKLDFGSFKYLKKTAQQMENMVFERFRNVFEIHPECVDFVVAAVACPILKMKFVQALSQIAINVSVEQIQSLFIEHAKEFQTEVVDAFHPVETEASTSKVHEFFDFGQISNAAVKKEIDPLLHVKKEFNRYLADEDHSLSSLDRYPTVKKVFLKYNTPLPSYASVRSLFDYSGVTSSRRKLRMSGRYFERLVVMKANKVFG